MQATKPRDLQFLPIANTTWVLRSRTWERLKFEIEYALQKGTTANSYLIQGDKIALFDPPGESFTEIFLSELEKRIAPQSLDYLILGHVNPNRSVTLSRLLELAPQVTIICSNPAALSLRQLFPEKTPNLEIVKGEDRLDLGQGHCLEFIPTSLPRWPDQLCTYDPKTQILFTDKLFGAHFCGDQVLDEGWAVYSEDRRYYFDCLMAPHARQVATVLDKLAAKPATIYATGHGPLVRYGLKELTDAYRTWASQQKQRDLSVALIYASAYGNTTILAQAIAQGITKAGVAVEAINAEAADSAQIEAAVKQADGFIFGSPTLGGHAPTQIQTALGIALAAADTSKLVGVFGSYGWSGEAIDWLENKFRDGGYRFGFDTLRAKFKPTDAVLKTCEEAGTDFAQALKQTKRTRQPKATSSTAARAEQALGRIIGSLGVLTARQGEVYSGMLASWVSQATFNPPGLTVAVAKERAVESLLHRGNDFVLNLLAEGQHLNPMKHFLKPFGPGEDRFAEIEWEEATNGCPILKSALAYLECRVENRLECGDHWLIYAIAQRGQVLRPTGITAVHHRKSGTHY